MRDLLLDMSDNLASDSKDVLDKIKADGTFDKMRVQVTEAVKQTDKLANQVQELVSQSDIFKSSNLDRLSRKELFDALRKAHEKQLLEMAAAATWEVLNNDEYGISQQIEHSVHEALCAVYEAREQERLSIHQAQQQRHQQNLEHYSTYYGSH